MSGARWPSKEQLDRLVRLIGTGNHTNVAAAACGISERVVYAWIAEAQRPDARPKVVRLVQSITKARAVAEASMLQVVTRAAVEGDTRSAQWYLERVAPQRWGRAERPLEQTGQTTAYVNPREQLAEALALLGESYEDDPIETTEALPAPTPLRRKAV